MKFIYVMVLFSSMLLAMQKQIILGSYSVESNGLNAVKTVEKQIENDETLKMLMHKNSAAVMSTVISGYTVVSVNIFDSYSSLLPAMKVLKNYYGDAYVLKYPTDGFFR
ncbi:MAG: hypothetical protein Q9M43_06460 [Sulfurimonas sp.]|nr:hypothetical protein [Sulfurimonas sp.]